MLASLGLVAVNQMGQTSFGGGLSSKPSLFLSDNLSANEQAFQAYLAQYGKSYKTQDEY